MEYTIRNHSFLIRLCFWYSGFSLQILYTTAHGQDLSEIHLT